jgi:hypothetical protein
MGKRHLQRLGLCLGLGVVALAMSPGGTRTASACAMHHRRMPVMSPARARELLVASVTAARSGELREAQALADRVVRSGVADAKVRAEALALVGWVDWQQGRRKSALRMFRNARFVDSQSGVVDRVLEEVGPTVALAELRRALGA